MRKILFAALLAFTAVCSAFASDSTRVVFGPWVTNVTETSFTVMWTTNERMLSAVEVSPASSSREVFYESVTGRRHNGTVHKVEVTGLQKGTAYTYSIFGEPCIDDSDPYKMKFEKRRFFVGGKATTLDSTAPSCRFVMTNDIHCDDSLFTQLFSNIDSYNPDFILLNGDVASYCESDEDLLSHQIAPIQTHLYRYPLFVSRGNHETRGPAFESYVKYFPTATGGCYYCFRHGPVGIMVLDAGEDKPDDNVEYSGTADFDAYRSQELEWLKKAVKDPTFAEAPQKICVIHIPTYNEPGAWYGQRWVSEHFMPVLNEAGVTLMLSGHYHEWIFAEKNKYGNNYEIIVNDSCDLLDFNATATEIKVSVYDLDGKLKHEFSK
mgnify:CR=1 FL=1